MCPGYCERERKFNTHYAPSNHRFPLPRRYLGDLRVLVFQVSARQAGKTLLGWYDRRQKPLPRLPVLPLKRAWIALVLCVPIACAIWVVRRHAYAPQTAKPTIRTAAVVRSLSILLDQARLEYRSGNFSKALVLLNRAVSKARDSNDRVSEAKALVGIAACQMGLFDYRDALRNSDAGRRLAAEAGDQVTVGASWINRSSVFYQLGDFDSVKDAAVHAVAALDYSGRPDLLARALLLEGRLYWNGKDQAKADDIYKKAILVARQLKSSPALEAAVWDEYGTALLLGNRIEAARQKLLQARDIELAANDHDGLAFTYEHLAELELRRPSPDYPAAKQDSDKAFSTDSVSFRISPQYYPLHIRAKILAGLGNSSAALIQFRQAVDAANTWRRNALPGDATSTRTVAELQEVYGDYTELAAETALAHNDASLARKALETLAENRAASLREQLARSFASNLRLPPAYFGLLTEIQRLQASVTLGQNRRDDEARLEQARLKLSDLENELGLSAENSLTVPERKLSRNSLRSVQFRLSGQELLLSFYLGNKKSFLWAVTKDQIVLYELPAGVSITRQVESLARSHGTADLSATLFGQLPRALWSKRDWLITADGALLNVPFSTLVSQDGSSPLIASHTIRFLPSEYLLITRTPEPAEPRFVGVGDPIYNLADSRRVHAPVLAKAKHINSAITLARLVGSGKEVQNAAALSGLSDSTVLEGPEATVSALAQALKRPPEILHLALHVVSPEGRPQEAALALSLDASNMPELVTPETIAALRVPGSLVILSGCSSGQGQALPGAGVIGLSRAWLLAGAAAVIVSAWPTPDDSGTFFTSFYDHLRSNTAGSLAQRAATALAHAQLDMRHAQGDGAASPWATYSIISKE